jgi:hypothetical protein
MVEGLLLPLTNVRPEINGLITIKLSKSNPFGTEEFVQFRQVFGLYRSKLHRNLVDRTVKSVWFRQV